MFFPFSCFLFVTFGTLLHFSISLLQKIFNNDKIKKNIRMTLWLLILPDFTLLRLSTSEAACGAMACTFVLLDLPSLGQVWNSPSCYLAMPHQAKCFTTQSNYSGFSMFHLTWDFRVRFPPRYPSQFVPHGSLLEIIFHIWKYRISDSVQSISTIKITEYHGKFPGNFLQYWSVDGIKLHVTRLNPDSIFSV